MMENILIKELSKEKRMDQLKRAQLEHECNTLRRSLLFLKEENIVLKNRLSEILKDSFDKNLLEQAELFHNDFIRKDARIHLLRNDLAGLYNLLAKIINNEKDTSLEIDARLGELRNNTNIAENQFIKMQSDFNKYFYDKM
ncbi:MAG: hypothetical protein ABIY62_03605 [Ginsengibacter sp.]